MCRLNRVKNKTLGEFEMVKQETLQVYCRRWFGISGGIGGKLMSWQVSKDIYFYSLFLMRVWGYLQAKYHSSKFGSAHLTYQKR